MFYISHIGRIYNICYIFNCCKQLSRRMIFTEKTKGNELYVYMNGTLIYKKWLETGQSKVFDVMAYDKYTLKSIKKGK